MEQQLEQLSKACSIAEASALGLLKSHISEYTRQDGTVVQAHDDSRQSRQTNSRSEHHRKQAEHLNTSASMNGRTSDYKAKTKKEAEMHEAMADYYETGKHNAISRKVEKHAKDHATTHDDAIFDMVHGNHEQRQAKNDASKAAFKNTQRTMSSWANSRGRR
jgi:hypothetical protein